MKEPAIALSHLSFAYEHLPVLQGINVEIRCGEAIGIVGPNGGGKTTLLKLLMGFLEPTIGEVRIFGLEPAAARLRIGYVPQFHRVDRDFPISVLELVLLGALSKISFWGAYPSSIKQKGEELIDELGLSFYKNKPFYSLSGGLAQRALLARALLSDPDLLLLDELTANIDAPSSSAIFQRLKALRGHTTILLVTHELKAIGEQVDRVLSVQGHITSLLPSEVCNHFALGLYHQPLSPTNRCLSARS